MPSSPSLHADRQHGDHHAAHAHHRAGHGAPDGAAPSLSRTAFLATVHCLSGCAIGEVAGMVIGTAFGLHNAATVTISIFLAFVSGYALTSLPLRRAGLPWGQVARLAFASDTASIALMELVDNALMLVIPGAMTAGLATVTFWASLAASLVIAGAAAFPLNRWLIGRGMGHAVVHAHHQHHHH